MPAAEEANALVDAFKSRAVRGAFPKLSRENIAKELKARITTPTLINQGNAGLCPSAAVVYGIARSRPVEYVQAVIDLYEKGTARIDKWDLKPCADLKNYELSLLSDMAEADWIIMASIRDTENWLIDYQDYKDDGGAWGGEVVKWLKKAGFTDVQEDWNRLMNKTKANLKAANDLYNKEYHVILLIDYKLLTGATAVISRPNHWVVLSKGVSNVTDDKKDVTMEVFTWGGTQALPKNAMILDDFVDYYYGYVAAKF